MGLGSHTDSSTTGIFNVPCRGLHTMHCCTTVAHRVLIECLIFGREERKSWSPLALSHTYSGMPRLGRSPIATANIEYVLWLRGLARGGKLVESRNTLSL